MGALGAPAFSTSAVASPSGQLWAGGSGVNIDYNNCGVASVTRASEVESLAIYYADADGKRQLRSGVDPTTGDQHQYRPIIVEHSSGSDKTKIQLTGSGGPLVHIVADLYSGGRTAKSNTPACFPEGFNSPPTVSITAETEDTGPVSGAIEVDVGEPVTFRSQSGDDDLPNDRLQYEWDLDGDGVYEKSGESVTASYATTGPRTVELLVTDDFDREDTAALDVEVVDPVTWSAGERLVTEELAMFDRFGNAVAAAGDTLVVGASFTDVGVDDTMAGAAYLYGSSGDSPPHTKLVSDEPDSGDQFGDSVAVSGDTVVVGSIFDDDVAMNSGAVYVYDLGGDSATSAKLAPGTLGSWSRFGGSTAMSGDTLVVGSVPDGSWVSGSGSAYVYDLGASSPTPTELAPPGLADGDQFGASVGVTGASAVVGAPRHGVGGAAFLFDSSSGSLTSTSVVPSDVAAGDRFGSSVAADGDTLVVGATGDDEGGTDAGAAYVYDLTDLSAAPTKLVPDTLDAGAAFGASVAVSGGTVVVGAPFEGDSGAAYAYDAAALSSTHTRFAPAGIAAGDRFGASVTVSGDAVVVGAPRTDGAAGSEIGAAYLFEQ